MCVYTRACVCVCVCVHVHACVSVCVKVQVGPRVPTPSPVRYGTASLILSQEDLSVLIDST